MKNLPHQFNKLPRLRAVLATSRDIGARTGDDEDFGYEMAGRGVYTFRGLVTPLAARIAAEKLKPRGSQGAQTAARDLRRLLTDLGYLQGSPSWAVTPLGTALLASTPGSTAELDVWRTAITTLTVTDDDGQTSRAGCILLRLLADTGGLPKHALGLALEPVDDSVSEYRRALALTGLTKEDRRTTLGITKYSDDDSVKVLPALAEQAGLIEKVADVYRLTAAGLAAHTACAGGGSAAPTPPPAPAPPGGVSSGRGRVRSRGAGGPVSRARRWVDRPAGLEPGELEGEELRVLSPEEQQRAARLRRERNRRHNAIVATLAGLATNEAVDLHEDPLSYDLVVEPLAEDQPLVLTEVKTLELDVETQARLAIGQLLWYRERVVARQWPGRDIELVAVFDGPVPGDVVEVFDALDIGVGVIDENGYHAVNVAADRTKEQFGA